MSFFPQMNSLLCGLWGWGSGDRLPSAVLYIGHLFCAVLDRVGNNSDGENPRSCPHGTCDSLGSSHGLVCGQGRDGDWSYITDKTPEKGSGQPVTKYGVVFQRLLLRGTQFGGERAG